MFFIGNLTSASRSWRSRLLDFRAPMEAYVGREHLYDVGRMMLGFCTLWAYLFWAQCLVIWYGDLPA